MSDLHTTTMVILAPSYEILYYVVNTQQIILHNHRCPRNCLAFIFLWWAQVEWFTPQLPALHLFLAKPCWCMEHSLLLYSSFYASEPMQTLNFKMSNFHWSCVTKVITISQNDWPNHVCDLLSLLLQIVHLIINISVTICSQIIHFNSVYITSNC